MRVDILCGPTAVGKNWVTDRLKDTHQLVVSTTTRQPRDQEVNGIDNYFISISEFERALKHGEMATAFVYKDNYYGYYVEELENINQSSKRPVAIIYYLALNVFLEKFPNSKIFFIFPSQSRKAMELLRKRMLGRSAGEFLARWNDTLRQMKAMYIEKPTLLEKYPGSELFTIDNDESALKLIERMKQLD